MFVIGKSNDIIHETDLVRHVLVAVELVNGKRQYVGLRRDGLVQLIKKELDCLFGHLAVHNQLAVGNGAVRLDKLLWEAHSNYDDIVVKE